MIRHKSERAVQILCFCVLFITWSLEYCLLNFGPHQCPVHGNSAMLTVQILLILLAYRANLAVSFSHQEVLQAAPINQSSTNVSSFRVHIFIIGKLFLRIFDNFQKNTTIVVRINGIFALEIISYLLITYDNVQLFMFEKM